MRERGRRADGGPIDELGFLTFLFLYAYILISHVPYVAHAYSWRASFVIFVCVNTADVAGCGWGRLRVNTTFSFLFFEAMQKHGKRKSYKQEFKKGLNSFICIRALITDIL